MGGCDNNKIPQAGCGQDSGEALETGRVALNSRFGRVRIGLSGAGLSLLLAVTGCGAFFQCEGKSDCGTTSSTSSSGDYAYISNSTTGSNYINGFDISSGSLTAATGSPYSLGFVPVAMAVDPSNDSFLYISSGTNIYGYSIGTGGALTILNSGTTLQAENCAQLAISPDGQWLFSLNSNDLTIEEYKIASTGLLSYVANYQITNSYSGAIAAAGIQVAPSGAYFAVALGTAGTEIFSFNTSTGAGAYASQISASSATSGDYGVAIDSNNNLYIATTNNLYVFSVTSAGVPTQVSTSTTGTGPYSVALDGTSYVYAGSESSSSSPILSGFNVSTSNPLVPVTGSPFTGPTDVSAIAVDKTAKYLIAAGYNATGGIQLFTIGSAGALTSGGTAATGTTTTVPTVMALTH